jgi:hypothetical protein
MRGQYDYDVFNFTNIREVVIVLKKQNKNILHSTKNKKSMQQLVENEGWPAGGLIELRYLLRLSNIAC